MKGMVMMMGSLAGGLDENDLVRRYFLGLDEKAVVELTRKISVTTSIEQIMTSRIDGLPAISQELCKVLLLTSSSVWTIRRL